MSFDFAVNGSGGRGRAKTQKPPTALHPGANLSSEYGGYGVEGDDIGSDQCDDGSRFSGSGDDGDDRAAAAASGPSPPWGGDDGHRRKQQRQYGTNRHGHRSNNWNIDDDGFGFLHGDESLAVAPLAETNRNKHGGKKRGATTINIDLGDDLAGLMDGMTTPKGGGGKKGKKKQRPRGGTEEDNLVGRSRKHPGEPPMSAASRGTGGVGRRRRPAAVDDDPLGQAEAEQRYGGGLGRSDILPPPPPTIGRSSGIESKKRDSGRKRNPYGEDDDERDDDAVRGRDAKGEWKESRKKSAKEEKQGFLGSLLSKAGKITGGSTKSARRRSREKPPSPEEKVPDDEVFVLDDSDDGSDQGDALRKGATLPSTQRHHHQRAQDGGGGALSLSPLAADEAFSSRPSLYSRKLRDSEKGLYARPGEFGTPPSEEGKLDNWRPVGYSDRGEKRSGRSTTSSTPSDLETPRRQEEDPAVAMVEVKSSTASNETRSRRQNKPTDGSLRDKGGAANKLRFTRCNNVAPKRKEPIGKIFKLGSNETERDDIESDDSTASHQSVPRNKSKNGRKGDPFRKEGKRQKQSNSGTAGSQRQKKLGLDLPPTWRTSPSGTSLSSSSQRKSGGISPSSFHSKTAPQRNNSKSREPGNNTRTKTRTRSQRKKRRAVTITIEDSVSEEDSDSDSDSDWKDGSNSDRKENMTEAEQIERAKRQSLLESTAETSSPKRNRKVGGRPRVDAVRIAVGKKVFHSGCELILQPSTDKPYLGLSFIDASGEKMIHKISLLGGDDGITEMRYSMADEDEGTGDSEQGGHGGMKLSQESSLSAKSARSQSDEDDSTSFIAMRVIPNSKNEFHMYSSAYLQNDVAENKGSDARRFIVVEIRSNEEFKAILALMRENPVLETFLGKDSQLQPDDIPQYMASLIEDDRKERKRRLNSLASPQNRRRTRSLSRAEAPGKTSTSNDDVLLVYPFVAEERVFEVASQGLNEAKVVPDKGAGSKSAPAAEDGQSEGEISSNGGSNRETKAQGKANGRTHYLTIRSDDRDRLEPGEFLNDTLVDFWMKWISRREGPDSDPSVHFFTSHFYTTLHDDGPAAVSSWTAKKAIDIFEKKFIFLPINESLHWSLCAVVNPGHIGNADMARSERRDADLPCILFMDSLKAHRKNRVARDIRRWLNHEWKRLEKSEAKAPFHNDSMPVFDPKIPYQDNSWDCGVFVCRYAYALYSQRNKRITFRDSESSPIFAEAITRSHEFQFDMRDIARVRGEMGVLVDNLSRHYLEIKERERAEKKAKKVAKKSSDDADRDEV